MTFKQTKRKLDTATLAYMAERAEWEFDAEFVNGTLAVLQHDLLNLSSELERLFDKKNYTNPANDQYREKYKIIAELLCILQTEIKNGMYIDEEESPTVVGW
jgi:hypothetical protein